MGDASNETAFARVAQISNEDDELGIGRGEGCNVVPLVVGVGAGEGLASGEGGVAVLGEDLLDAVSVIGVDDGRDIEVGSAAVAVEAELGQHAWHVSSPLRD